ncbi:MAG: hypothetical protein ACRDJK_12375, partial [Actinomycetota bacterium]
QVLTRCDGGLARAREEVLGLLSGHPPRGGGHAGFPDASLAHIRGEIGALFEETGRLRAELAQLRELLARHGIKHSIDYSTE